MEEEEEEIELLEVTVGRGQILGISVGPGWCCSLLGKSWDSSRFVGVKGREHLYF